ncbi:hypothetical protein VD0001_g3983 [Verticillium dahliae]|nr:hypothetical protein VD0001_g3983 [Verticillium dahliae]
MPRSQGAATTGGGSHGRISKKGSKEEAPKKPEQQQEPEQPKGTKEAKNSSETTQDDVAVEKVVPTQPESRPASKQSSRPTSSQVDPDKSCTPTAEFVQRPQAMSWAEEVEVSIQQHVTQRSTSPENELPGADPMIDSKSCTEDVDSIPSAADENPIHDGSVVEAPDAPIQEAPEHVDSSSSTADEDPTQDDDSAAEAPVEPNQETAEHANPGSQPVQAVSRSTPNSTQLNVDDSTAETLDGAQQNITDEVRNSAESLFHGPDARARVRLPPAAEPQQTLLDEPQEPQEPQELAGPQSQDVDVPSEQPAVPPHTSAAKNPQCPQNGQQQSMNKAIARALDSTPERTRSHSHGRTPSHMLSSTFNSRIKASNSTIHSTFSRTKASNSTIHSKFSSRTNASNSTINSTFSSRTKVSNSTIHSTFSSTFSSRTKVSNSTIHSTFSRTKVSNSTIHSTFSRTKASNSTIHSTFSCRPFVCNNIHIRMVNSTLEPTKELLKHTNSGNKVLSNSNT